MAVLPLLLTWGLFSHCPALEASLIDRWQGVGWYIKLLFFKNQTKISSSPKCWYTENARCSTPQLTSALCNLPAGDLCAAAGGTFTLQLQAEVAVLCGFSQDPSSNGCSPGMGCVL